MAQHPRPQIFEATFVELNEMTNSVEVHFPAVPSSSATYRGVDPRLLRLPLDQLSSVWTGVLGVVHVMVDVMQFVPYEEVMKYLPVR
jgi:hypothetical protein